jgi:hypothetical protein
MAQGQFGGEVFSANGPGFLVPSRREAEQISASISVRWEPMEFLRTTGALGLEVPRWLVPLCVGNVMLICVCVSTMLNFRAFRLQFLTLSEENDGL